MMLTRHDYSVQTLGRFDGVFLPGGTGTVSIANRI
jgi:hypothetical protein